MKKFEEPIIEVIAFNVADVVTTSSNEEPPALGGMLDGNACVS